MLTRLPVPERSAIGLQVCEHSRALGSRGYITTLRTTLRLAPSVLSQWTCPGQNRFGFGLQARSCNGASGNPQGPTGSRAAHFDVAPIGVQRAVRIKGDQPEPLRRSVHLRPNRRGLPRPARRPPVACAALVYKSGDLRLVSTRHIECATPKQSLPPMHVSQACSTGDLLIRPCWGHQRLSANMAGKATTPTPAPSACMQRVRGRGPRLRDVEHVAQLRKVGRHVAPPRQREELVVLAERVRQRQRREEGADVGHHALEAAAPRVLRAGRPAVAPSAQARRPGAPAHWDPTCTNSGRRPQGSSAGGGPAPGSPATSTRSAHAAALPARRRRQARDPRAPGGARRSTGPSSGRSLGTCAWSASAAGPPALDAGHPLGW